MQQPAERHCPVCGANLVGAGSCDQLWYRTQEKEFTDAGYGAVHHLSVPCYMIQHNAYSRAGFWQVRDLLQRFVLGLEPQVFRRQEGAKQDNKQRSFSIVKGEKLNALDGRRWSFTVSDVRLENAEDYCRDVRQWAESVLVDTAELERQQ